MIGHIPEPEPLYTFDGVLAALLIASTISLFVYLWAFGLENNLKHATQQIEQVMESEKDNTYFNQQIIQSNKTTVLLRSMIETVSCSTGTITIRSIQDSKGAIKCTKQF